MEGEIREAGFNWQPFEETVSGQGGMDRLA